MLEQLKQTRVLKEATSDELQAVAKLCQEISLKDGERLFEGGTPAESMYLVVKGAVELRFPVTHYLASSDIAIDRVSEDDVLGWSSLSESKTYTLSALAVQDSKLLKIDAKALRKLCSENNHLGYVLMKNLNAITGDRLEMIQRALIGVIQQQLTEKERRM